MSTILNRSTAALVALLLTATLHAAEIHDAAQAGDVEVLRDIIADDPAQLDVLNDIGASPIVVAAVVGHEEAVLFLLDAGAEGDDRAAWNAAYNGNFDIVSAMQRRGVLLPVRDAEGTTILMLTAKYGQVERCRDLLELELDPDETNTAEMTALHYAALYGQAECARLLLDAGADVEKAEVLGLAPLHLALNNDHAAALGVLVRHGGADASRPMPTHSPDGTLLPETNVPLIIAASSGLRECAIVLLDGNADIDVEAPFTPLIFAILGGHTETARLLIERGADLAIADTVGSTPLHNAIRKEGNEIVRLLLERGATVHAKNHAGHSPVATAIEHRNLVALRLVIEAGGNPNDRHEGVSTMQVAAVKKDVEFAEWLLDHGADPNAFTEGHNAPIMIACLENDLPMMRLLVDRGANVKFRNELRESPATVAVARKNTEMLRTIIAAGGDPNAAYEDEHALQLAVRHQDDPLVDLLLKRGADPNLMTGESAPPLFLACLAENLEIARRLIDAGADPTGQNYVGQTAMTAAMAKKKPELLRLIVEAGGDPDTVFHDSSALQVAIRKEDGDLVGLLLDKGADPNLHEGDSAPPLVIASFRNNLDLVRRLIDAGADTRATNSIGESSAVMAVALKNLEMLRMLVAAGGDPNAAYEDDHAMQLAVRQEDDALVDLLLKRGADPNLMTGESAPPLFSACMRENIEIARRLIDAGADPTGQNHVGQTSVVAAIAKKNPELLRLIVEAGGDPNTVLHGSSALQVAIRKEDGDLVGLLLEKGADPNLHEGDSAPPLFIACLENDLDMVRRLIDAGAHIRATNAIGETAAVVAIALPNLEMLRLLIIAGGDPNAAFKGRTALELAVDSSSGPLVRLLLERGADTSATNGDGMPILASAAATGDLDLVKVLVGHGVDPNDRRPWTDSDTPNCYYTALFFAARANSLPVVEYLLEQGARPDVPGDDGQTALDEAAYHGNVPMMRRLVERGARIEGRGEVSPLMAAITEGHEHAVSFLLDLGANPNAHITEEGWTPIQLAAYLGHAGVARRLLEAGADYRVVVQIFTALALAAAEGHADVVRVLLDHGAPTASADNGNRMLLSIGVSGGNPDVVRALLGTSAIRRELEYFSDDGRTTLIYAARQGEFEMVKLLVEAGADINAAVNVRSTNATGDEIGKTARQVAALYIGKDVGDGAATRDEGRRKIVAFLEARGAR